MASHGRQSAGQWVRIAARKAIQSVPLTAGVATDVISVGALAMWVHKSGERFAIRVRDPDSPLRKKFTGLSWFPLDPTYRLTARFVPYDTPKPAPMINILGDIERFTSPGYVVFELGGQTLRLEPVASEENDLFFVFRDGTSGRETYAAARFLHTGMPQVRLSQHAPPPWEYTTSLFTEPRFTKK